MKSTPINLLGSLWRTWNDEENALLRSLIWIVGSHRVVCFPARAHCKKKWIDWSILFFPIRFRQLSRRLSCRDKPSNSFWYKPYMTWRIEDQWNGTVSSSTYPFFDISSLMVFYSTSMLHISNGWARINGHLSVFEISCSNSDADTSAFSQKIAYLILYKTAWKQLFSQTTTALGRRNWSR